MWEIMDVRKNFIKVLFLCVFFFACHNSHLVEGE